jgi:hypothetical protein
MKKLALYLGSKLMVIPRMLSRRDPVFGEQTFYFRDELLLLSGTTRHFRD